MELLPKKDILVLRKLMKFHNSKGEALDHTKFCVDYRHE